MRFELGDDGRYLTGEVIGSDVFEALEARVVPKALRRAVPSVTPVILLLTATSIALAAGALFLHDERTDASTWIGIVGAVSAVVFAAAGSLFSRLRRSCLPDSARKCLETRAGGDTRTPRSTSTG